MSRWTLITLLALAGCDAPAADVDAGADASAAAPEDAGSQPTPDDAGGHEPDAGPEAVEVSFTAPPPSVTHVRGTVELQLVAQGGAPEAIELWKNGAILVSLSAPYAFSWDTDAEGETSHVIEARAIVGGAVVGRAERTFVVDRTPPAIVGRTPAPDAASVGLADPISIVFSEPVAGAGLTGAITLAVGESALAHTVERVAPERVEVRLTEAPEATPATATVTIGGGITDLAGNALGADDAWSFTYPAWIERAPLGGTVGVLDATVAGDGTVWVVYRVSTEAGMEELRAARWNGASWFEIPNPVREADAVYEARIRTRASGRAVVAWSGGLDSTYETRLRELNGTSWVGYSPPRRSAEHATALDLEIEADGSVVLSRQLDEEYLVDRYTGSWSAVGTPLAVEEAYYSRHTDLLPTDEGLLLAYVSAFDCKLVRESGAAWTSPVDIHSSSSDSSRCTAVRLVESGDAEGALHAFIDYRTYRDRYSTWPSTAIRVESESGSWTSMSGGVGLASIDNWLGAVRSSTGWYALGRGASTYRVFDESLAALGGDLPSGVRVLAAGERPIVITTAPSVLERNAP